MIRRTLLYFGNPCAVCSSVSDEPKLYGGGPILINRLVYNGSHPLRGDILKCQVIRISPTITLNTKHVMRLVRDQSRVSGLRYKLWPPFVQKRPLFVCLVRGNGIIPEVADGERSLCFIMVERGGDDQESEGDASVGRPGFRC